ncbi:hypothetical protein LMJ53_04865 [Rheinheimera sp. UJ51]|uniref:hypothetical protein n=1 Tax=Rheinheimera sp. UJ51 TaxID=2892446 RepID=UPI001E5B51A0|nr:hypothetical protein [Rheinheimera sp. UJ51]MCC5451066.1 hypothetical protein [Rheinheimera sp. UJ51]
MKPSITRLISLLLLFALAGCSNKAVYQNLQLNKKQQCQQLPVSQYDECMRSIPLTYEEYERERQEVLKTSKKTKD